jgi:biotin carboxyl carrier protein
VVDLIPSEDGWIAEIGGERFIVSAAALPDGGWQLVIDGRARLAYVAAEGDQRYVWCAGAQAALARGGGRGRRGGAGATGGGLLSAQMPGQVRALLVAEGDAVVRGQTLLILEAMKMELRVSAPADGVVRAVHVWAGALVERGAALIELALAEG